VDAAPKVQLTLLDLGLSMDGRKGRARHIRDLGAFLAGLLDLCPKASTPATPFPSYLLLRL
jgi:hypothetical protein